MPASRSVEGERRRATAAPGILIAVYRGHLEVHRALEELKRSGLGLARVSVVGTDYHTEENVYGYYSTGGRLQAWGSLGAFWSGVWAALSGGGYFHIPRLGAVVMAGPLVGWLAGELEKGAMEKGLSVLGATLTGRGIPSARMLECETALRAGEFLLVASGAMTEVAKSRAVIEAAGGRVSVHPLQ